VNKWNGASAIVTGAASGIGLALSEALVARGADVWLADINVAGAQAAAAKHVAQLDVRDASSVQALVELVAAEHGSLDYFFNNAGIGLGGEAHELTTEHYDRIIDINVRGVTNGIAAAYPVMVKQRSGHIINTASMAGLVPVPLLTPYAMTKHAVVGLSVSLRLEAENFGVRISALCPAAIDTPLLDTETSDDLPKPWGPNIRRYLARFGSPALPVAKLADEALRGVERNRAVIVIPAMGRLAVLLYRIAPGLVLHRTRRALAAELSERPSPEK
jgi:NAD(P)-dependent dehydrogenase (short-subunit alcohol dehydrogenase family)